MRRIVLTVVLPLCFACLPATALGAPRVSLNASFTPNRLGASTTIGFDFRIARENGHAPPPLTAVNLRMPAGLSYASSTLGLAICAPNTLILKGLRGCAPNSRLGHGSARVEVPFGEGVGREIPDIEAVMGPPHNGNVEVLFYANGQEPIFAQLVFGGELLPAGGRYGTSLATTVPIVSSVAGGPPVSILEVSSTIGPRGLTYYHRVHGRAVAYSPQGLEIPLRCPRGGFPFAADFTFMDGSQASARTAVRCPRPRR